MADPPCRVERFRRCARLHTGAKRGKVSSSAHHGKRRAGLGARTPEPTPSPTPVPTHMNYSSIDIAAFLYSAAPDPEAFETKNFTEYDDDNTTDDAALIEELRADVAVILEKERVDRNNTSLPVLQTYPTPRRDVWNLRLLKSQAPKRHDTDTAQRLFP